MGEIVSSVNLWLSEQRQFLRGQRALNFRRQRQGSYLSLALFSACAMHVYLWHSLFEMEESICIKHEQLLAVRERRKIASS
jgi:hypothetical protein